MTDRPAVDGKENIDLLAGDAWTRARHAAASGDRCAVRFWFDRVSRLAPDDPRPRLELARVLLVRDSISAFNLFLEIATGFDLAEAWATVAALALRLSRRDEAARALAALLSRHRIERGGDVATLADAVTAAVDAPRAGAALRATDGYSYRLPREGAFSSTVQQSNQSAGPISATAAALILSARAKG